MRGTYTYPSGYLVTDPYGNYSKHYYNGSQRIASRVGDGTCSRFEKTSDEMSDLQKMQKESILENVRAMGMTEVKYEPYSPVSLDELEESDSSRAVGTISIYYYHPDHLGTNTLINDMSGNPSQFFLNLPFGETMSDETANVPAYLSPYKFNGKELDDGTGMYYYGARYYDPRISVWMSVDPLAEKRSWLTPYNYCQNNPVGFIDPIGALDNPIYDGNGDFLGTDDLGIQGEAIIMDKSDFKQGMSHKDALSKGTLRSNLPMVYSSTFLDKIDNHHSNLPNRPDWDGYLTLDEANKWYRTGGGQPLYTDLSKIDLSGINSTGEKSVGQVKSFNLLIHSNSINDGLVYGNITLKRYPNDQVRAYADKYNFEMHNAWNPLNWGRNAQTIIGSKVAGEGMPFEINIYNSKTLTPSFLPWNK